MKTTMFSSNIVAGIMMVGITLCNADLYGAYMGVHGGLDLRRIDPKTGNSTLVASIPKMAQAQQLTSADREAGIFYVLGFDTLIAYPVLIAVDVKTGGVNETALPFAESVFVGVGQAVAFDKNTGNVICMGRLKSDPKHHHIISISPTTGEWKDVGAVDTKHPDIDVLGADASLDPTTDTMYVMLGVNDTTTHKIGIDIVSVDLQNGGTTMIKENTIEMTTLDWDPNHKRFVGQGVTLVDGKILRVITELDPKTNTFKTLGNAKLYFIESGGTAAYDPVTNHVFGVLSPKGKEFYLVTTDAGGTGASDNVVVQAAKLCSNPVECPWSLEWI